jgi:hypothetical protein
MLRMTSVLLAAAVGITVAPAGATPAPDLLLTVDGRDSGRVFDGIGAVTNAFAERLLYDYPEPQRSQILDYLFEPGYGASLQHLKHDMGGDSGGGVATRHEPGDESFNRGTGWWLMREARKRNPNIILSLLQSSAPGWVGGYFTQANLDYIVSYLEGARRHHGLTFDYVAGVVNEPSMIGQTADWAWVKRLEKTMRERGITAKLVVGDDQVRTCCPTNLPWPAAEAMRDDPELAAAVDVIGSHYAGGSTPEYVKEFGKPIWSSEDGPWTDGWNSFVGGSHNALGSTYNLNYIDGAATSTLYWTLVSAFYDNLILPNNGLMRAAQPWSGHYRVSSPVWVTAHTTQFTRPGWRYLDRASVRLPRGGSVVTLAAPNGRDHSAIFETQRMPGGETVPTERQTVRVHTGGGGVMRVWRSTRTEWFTRQPDIRVVDGAYEITLEPDAIYSVTTTSGQRKGAAPAPPPAPFPHTYRDTFETGRLEQQPRYLAQQGGSYELTPCAGGRGGRCVEQVVGRRPLQWMPSFPITFLGDERGWSDVSVSTRVLHREPGTAEVWARLGNWGAGPDLDVPILPDGYYLSLTRTGDWELGHTTDGERHRLAAGHTELAVGRWHTIEITARGSRIGAVIDGTEVGHATDSTYTSGRAGIGTGWNRAQFDDLAVAGRHVLNGPFIAPSVLNGPFSTSVRAWAAGDSGDAEQA